MPNVYQPITQSGKWPGSFDMLSKAMPQKQQAPQQQGSQKPPDMSMYSPGRAQPVQEQSQGTPYGAQLTGGNYAYATPENRPAPFTQRYTNFDGTVSEQPNFGQRDAFIQNINDAMLPYYSGQAKGPPQFDFQSMYRRAGDMVKNGWQNPFAQQPPATQSLDQQLAQYAPPSQYQPASSPWDSFRNADPMKPTGGLSPVAPVQPLTQRAPRYSDFADIVSQLPSPRQERIYYDPSTGMATNQPPSTSQPPVAAPQTGNAIVDTNYDHGWLASVYKGAPQFQPIFAQGYVPKPGETDVIQPKARPPLLAGLRAAGDQNRVRSPEEEAIYRNNPHLLM